MNEWRETTLGEVIQLQRGFDLTEKQSEAGPYPVISSGGVRYYTATPKMEGPGVVTGRKGVLGKVHFSAGPYWPHDTTLWVRDFKGNDPRFIYYWLQTVPLAALDGGAANPTLNRNHAHLLEVRVPSLDLQIRIAEILGGIDDLIENNRRRISLLEQMVHAIYREWFVHFRYPGHEDDELVDSPLGPIPAGSRVRAVDELAVVVRGRSYRKHELVEEGGVPFINLKCMARGGGFRRDGLKRYAGPFKREQVTSAGDIVLAVTDLTQSREILARATLVPRLSEEHGVISLDVVRLVPRNSEDRIPLFAVLRYSDLADRVKEHANGSTVLHLSPDHVAAASIIWPAERVRRRAADLLGSMYSLCDELSDAADRLVRIRDLLLPKLVTGAIDVSKLDLGKLLEEPVT